MRLFISLGILFLINACDSGSNNSNSNDTVLPSIINSFTADTLIVNPGNYITLTWSSSNTNQCVGSSAWSGVKSTTGNEQIFLNQEGEFVFILTCSGATSVSSSITVIVDNDYEGTCVNPHSAEFDASFMGDFEIPQPLATLPSSHIRSVGLKDYTPRWIYNNFKSTAPANISSWVTNCTEDQYVRLMIRLTLTRLAEVGVSEVVLFNAGPWEDANAEYWVLANDEKFWPDADITYLTQVADTLGINVRLVWQFFPIDKNHNWLFPFDGQATFDLPLLAKAMEAHETNIINQAIFAESIGIGAISADWSSMWPCFCGLNFEYIQGSYENYNHEKINELKDYYAVRMSEIHSKIRSVFSGDIYMGEGPTWNDTRLVGGANYLLLSFNNLLSVEDNQSLGLDLMTVSVQDAIENIYLNWYCLDQQPCYEFMSNDSMNWVINLFAQSTRDFMYRGWIEDGFCTSGEYMGITDNDCIQNHVDIDFSAQAIYIEGMLRGTYNHPLMAISGYTVSTGYWWSDSLQPADGQNSTWTAEGFPNISQSIRGKPAENIVQYWYSGVFEEYTPN